MSRVRIYVEWRGSSLEVDLPGPVVRYDDVGKQALGDLIDEAVATVKRGIGL